MRGEGKPVNVAVYQPVIPDYRVPFFTALHRRREIELEIFASMSFPLCPETPGRDFEFLFRPVPGRSFLNNRLFWQSGLEVPARFQQGDVLVLCGNPRYVSNYPLLLAARMRGLGVVWWGHGHTPGSRRWSENVRKEIMRLADVILLYTDREVDEYRRSGFPEDCLTATNNTIDVSDVEMAMESWTPSRLAEFKQERGIHEGRNFLFCGRITGKARLGDALDAMATLVREDPGCRLIVIGDGPEKGALQARSRELCLERNVEWVGALYGQYELAPWFLSALAFVYPGSIGLSLLHAFAYGLPVVTHDLGHRHNPEFAALESGVNGMVFRYGDVSSLAQAMRALGREPAKARELGAQALKTIREDFPMTNMVERFVQAALFASRKAGRRRAGAA